MTGRRPWEGSTRRQRLPADWAARRAEADRRNPGRVCHLCGAPGGDALDHIIPGDDHSQDNLDWAHDRTPPHCHRRKSGQEGAATKPPRNRPPEVHPALR